MNHIFSRTLCTAVIAVFGASCEANADTVVYQNTTTAVSAFVFNGAATVGSDLAANVDINELILAPGYGGSTVTSISFQADNFNSTAVQARPVMYVWAANGAGGTPGTLLGTFALPLEALTTGTTTLSYSIAPGSLLVPANDIIYAGIGFDNDNGASSISAAQLNDLGGLTYNPATIGTDGVQAYFVAPGGAVNDPSSIAFGGANAADYGFTVTASTAPEPGVLSLLTLSAPLLLFGIRRARSNRS
jgi:hypothetical protein